MTRTILLALLCAPLIAQAQAATLGADVPPTSADSCVCTIGTLPPITSPIVTDNVNGIAADQFKMCKTVIPSTLPAGLSTYTCYLQVTGDATHTPAVGPAAAPFSFSNSAPITQTPVNPRLTK
jgi:hypothetical protein